MSRPSGLAARDGDPSRGPMTHESAFPRPGATPREALAGRDVGELHCLVTGATGGIGFETARALAWAGARVTLGSRDPVTGERAVEQIRGSHAEADVRSLPLDLASFSSIRAFAEALGEGPLDVLVGNAGVYLGRYEETEEGIERTVGVCHVGHFLLTRFLADRLLARSRPRVVLVSSESHRAPARLDFERFPLQASNYRALEAYGQAKLCNVLFARSLHRRYGHRGMVACALHPGALVSTGIGRNSALLKWVVRLARPFTRTPEQAALTPVVAAVWEPAESMAGAYLKDARPARSSAEGEDREVAERVWMLSEDWVASAGAPPWPEGDASSAPELPLSHP